MALSIIVVIALAQLAALLYIRNMAAERDRADAALRHSEAAKDALTLEHAELLLHSDPTAALASVRAYHGPDRLRVRQISAEARGRGVASSILNPHKDTIRLLAGLPDGSIASLGADRRIVITRSDITTTLADDIDLPIIVEYCEARHLLAYSSTGSG